MQVLCRVDASLQIGIGHVMRCLTLAEALRERGAECRFICREHKGHLLEQIRQRGFDAYGLPVCSERRQSAGYENDPNYSAWLGSDWATDAAQTKVGAGKTAIDWLIVDHYALDERWERVLRPVCHQLMVIDDLANRQHDCDLLLDQNLGRTTHDYEELVPKHCQLLVGPRYALLRPEFAAFRERSLVRRAQSTLKHVLIAMGGVDMMNVTEKILKVLVDAPLPKNCHITVVMGLHAPWLKQVRHIAAMVPQTIEIKSNVANMAQLMAESDLAIGAAGSTSWERCSQGLPSIIGVVAGNQIFIADALQAAGASKIFTVADDASALHILIAELADDPEELLRMSRCAANVCDGSGTSRVTHRLTL